MSDFSRLISAANQVPYLWWLAGYAALISSITLVWDIVKYYKQNVSLKVIVKSKMKMPNISYYGINAEQAAKIDYITCDVTNRGGKTTTISHVGLYIYKDRFRFWCKRRELALIISQTILRTTLPATLAPGNTVSFSQQETESIRASAKGKLSYIVISHAMSDKELHTKIPNF